MEYKDVKQKEITETKLYCLRNINAFLSMAVVGYYLSDHTQRADSKSLFFSKLALSLELYWLYLTYTNYAYTIEKQRKFTCKCTNHKS